jgi:hypothetical protein
MFNCLKDKFIQIRTPKPTPTYDEISKKYIAAKIHEYNNIKLAITILEGNTPHTPLNNKPN